MVIAARSYNDPSGLATDRDMFRYLHVLDELGSVVPMERKTTSPEDVQWFLMEGAVLFKDSWYLDEAVSLAQKILNKQIGGGNGL